MLLRQHSGLLLILILYLGIFLYMLPFRDQAYEDDFAYLHSVSQTLNQGQISISDWSSASFITQLLWGLLFAKIFGFSLSIMHLSTVILLLPGLICFYLLLKRFSIDDFRAGLFTSFLLAYPWVLQFSYSFLTDVPYLSLLVITLYCYVRALQDNSKLFYLLGSLFAALTFLIRQLGIVLPTAIVLILLYQSWLEKKLKLRAMIYSLTPFLLIAGWYNYWLSQPNHLTIGQYQSSFSQKFQVDILPYLIPQRLGFAGLTNTVFTEYVRRIIFNLHHTVGFLLPVFLIFRWKWVEITKMVANYRNVIIKGYIIYFFLLALEYFFHFGRTKYEIEIPRLITSFYTISRVNWTVYWGYLALVSSLIWVPILAILSQKVCYSLFTKRKVSDKRISNFILWIVVIYTPLRFIQEFMAVYKPLVVIPDFGPFWLPIQAYLTIAFSQKGIDFIYNNWFVFFALSILTITIAYLLTYYQPKRSGQTLKPATGLIILSFLLQGAIVIFFMYYNWAQYVISFIPFLLFSLALFTRQIAINFKLAMFILILVTVFSVSVTKNRYESIGIRWELGQRLIKQGVKPVDIDISSWAWIPFWYYEQTLAQQIKDFGGNKYLTTPRSPWRNIKPEGEFVYSMREVPPDYDPSQADVEIVYDTGPQSSSFFNQTRYIVYKNYN